MTRVFIARIVLLITILLPSAVFAGSVSYTSPGTYTFSVPYYGTLTVDVRGAGGGGGGGVGDDMGGSTANSDGAAGTASSFGGSVIGAAGGGGSTNGWWPSQFNNSGYCIGVPGAAGGGTGGSVTVGGGGTGGVGDAGPCYYLSGALNNGGAGGMTTQSYSQGVFTPGSTIAVVVGAGGAGGAAGPYGSFRTPVPGSPGASGAVYISWSAPPPASCSVSLSPNPINQGGSSTLSWSSTNADSYVYIQNVGYVTTSGSTTVAPSGTTDYSCYAAGTGGSDGWHSASLIVYQSCALPWGGSITNGQSATAYQASSVAYGATCTSETRSCSNGALSGSYQYQSCSVTPAANCVLDGATVAHGSSRTFYSSQTGSPCSALVSSRTCTNGTLSGSASYQYASCTCAPIYSCSGNSITYTNGSCTTTTITTCTTPYYCSPGTATCLSPQPSFNASGTLSGHLQMNPLLVRRLSATHLYWNVSNVQSCTVTGTNGDSWSGLSGDHVSSALAQQTSYTLHCVPLTGASFTDERATVGLTPQYQEL